MKKETITTLLLAIPILTFSQAKIAFDKTVYDFGYVSEGQKARYTFEFTNSGSDTLKLESVKPSCGCTSPNWSKEPVLPGEKGKIEVVYNSKNRLGEFNKSIRVNSNAVNDVDYLKISGVVAAPTKEINPDSIAISAKAELEKNVIEIGTVERLSKQNLVLELRNTGKSILKVEKIMSGCHCVTSNELVNIDPDKTKNIKLTFRGTEARDYKEKIVIQVNDPATPYIEFILEGKVVNSLRQDNMMQTTPGSGF